MIKKIILALAAVGGIVVLVICGADISAGVRCGLSVCGEVVIPSLFPFMVLANMILATGASDVLGKPLSFITCPIFRLPKVTAAPILLSYISGYPVGASIAARLHKQNRISRDDAERMLTFTVNSSPAMAIFAVGLGMLGSIRYGIILYCTHAAASFLTGIIFTRLILKSGKNTGHCSFSRKVRKKSSNKNSDSTKINEVYKNTCLPQKVNFADVFVNATADAASAMINICGCVILFAGITSALNNFTWLAAILEVTVGCRYASGLGLPLVAAVLGFGGLSVIFQILTLSKGLIRPLVLLASRLTHSLISYFICLAVIRLLPDKLIQVLSTGTPSVIHTVNITAPVSAALLLLTTVVMWSAKSAKN